MLKKLSCLREDIHGNKNAENPSGLIAMETGLENILSTGSVTRVNIMALGDVGTNLLMGLKLLGGDIIEEIGIYDLNEKQLSRLEMEFNQMAYPPIPVTEAVTEQLEPPSIEGDLYDNLLGETGRGKMPHVKIIKNDDELLNCDVLIFCASKGVPEIGTPGDVRMLQLEANLGLITDLGKKIKSNGFNGFVAVVSDPVDQLCKGLLESSGLGPGHIRGFGLGVMAARAKYFAEKDDRFSSFLTQGRAFGPHGKDLVIANSIDNYDEELSRELTDLTVEANLRVRELGFKPFLAPAISSAALSILMTLKGKWNYGSVYFGGNDSDGAYLGMLSRVTTEGVEFEDLEIPEALYNRIETAYRNLL